MTVLKRARFSAADIFIEDRGTLVVTVRLYFCIEHYNFSQLADFEHVQTMHSHFSHCCYIYQVFLLLYICCLCQ
jgi:hypothetical protein